MWKPGIGLASGVARSRLQEFVSISSLRLLLCWLLSQFMSPHEVARWRPEVQSGYHQHYWKELTVLSSVESTRVESYGPCWVTSPTLELGGWGEPHKKSLNWEHRQRNLPKEIKVLIPEMGIGKIAVCEKRRCVPLWNELRRLMSNPLPQTSLCDPRLFNWTLKNTWLIKKPEYLQEGAR